MTTSTPSSSYVLCVSNAGYPASLEVRKIYQGVADAAAERRGLIRIIDESGEDYLYPGEMFVPIKLPRPVLKALATGAPTTKARTGTSMGGPIAAPPGRSVRARRG